MTEKRCTDCRHTRGIGFDFWCGEGHTEYEVFGGTTDCPYFEYHDWSKGVPSRTAKRFTINDCRVLSDEQVFKILNQLTDENEQLKQDKDLFAQCICDLSNLLYDNKIEHKLPKDIKDFITVWGVRVE